MQNDLKARWQSQPAEGGTMSIEEIRATARRFEKRMRKTYNREYFAALTTIVWMAAYIWILKPVLFRVAAGLAIPAILLMLYQLRKRASPRALPADLALTSCVEFHRRELQRQRHARESTWRWYLLPFVPSILVWTTAVYFLPRGSLLLSSIFGACFLAMFLLIGQANQRAARQLQREIDELNSEG
jgi:hypothetical protein